MLFSSSLLKFELIKIKINMKKTLVILSALVLMFSAGTFAQTTDKSTANNKHGKAVSAAATQYHQEAAKLREEWKNLTPEQRQARKEEFQQRRAALKEKIAQMTPEERAAMKEKFDHMTPEQRAAMKDKMKDRRNGKGDKLSAEERAERKEKFENMTPEQRAAMKEKMQQRRQQQGQKGYPGKSHKGAGANKA
jgi:Spy/CpxP family protein refolding chaperone